MIAPGARGGWEHDIDFFALRRDERSWRALRQAWVVQRPAGASEYRV